jgi:hypothetical protein
MEIMLTSPATGTLRRTAFDHKLRIHKVLFYTKNNSPQNDQSKKGLASVTGLSPRRCFTPGKIATF